MKDYRSTAIVKADKIVGSRESELNPEGNRIIETADGSVYDTSLATVVNAPRDALDDGYYVEYPDGHVSIWRAADFEATFEEALG